MRLLAALPLAALLAAGDPDYPDADLRAILGVRMAPPSPLTQALNRTTPRDGVEVREVIPGTAAEAIGVEPGDLIVAINGGRIVLMQDLRNEVSLSGVGGEVAVEILRDGRPLALAGVLGAWPDDVPHEPLDSDAEIAYRGWQRRRWQRIESDMAGLTRQIEALERAAAAPSAPIAPQTEAALVAMPAIRLRVRLAVDSPDRGGTPPDRTVAWDARVLIGVPRQPAIH